MAVTRYGAADVLAQLLIAAGLVTDHDSDGQTTGDWPVTVGTEADEPANAVTIYDTEGVNYVQDMITGRVHGRDGFQVRVRASTRQVAMDKARELHDYFSRGGSNEGLSNVGVSIGTRYLVLVGCSGFGTVIDLGREPNSQRAVVVFNAMAKIVDRTQP